MKMDRVNSNERGARGRVTSGLRRLARLLGIGALAAFAPGAMAQTYLIDFGASGTPTSHGEAPGDPSLYWNNVPDSVGASATGVVSNFVTTANLPSGIGLAIVKPFNGANENGTTESTLYPLNATRDSLYGNTEAWNNLTDVFPSFKLTGLDPATVYNLTFYASRNGVGDNRETAYTVEGASTATVALDPANNTDNSVSLSDVKADANGEVTISLAPSENNNNSYHFTYLGVLKLEAIPPQTPIGFTLEPVSQRILMFQPVTFTAAVTGAPPYTVRWYQNGTEIPEVTGFSYTIPSATADLDGAAFSVSVSNLMYGARSTNAVLRVSADGTPPTILAVTSPSGFSAQLTFSEPLEPTYAVEPSFYMVNGQPAVSAALLPGGTNVFIAFAEQVEGSFTVAVDYVMDLAGNTVAPGTKITGVASTPDPECFLFDFGGGNTTELSVPPDDPGYFWNNIGTGVAASDTGEMMGLVTSLNRVTEVGLVMISRFNGVNENGSQASGLFAADATRDSLFGNTEAFSDLSDIFPSFKLVGLDPRLPYRFLFYASRTGVGDNRETQYTVVGARTNVVALNVANNVTNTAVASGVTPSAEGEVTISLAPGPNNNNANHFTYLGVMKITQASEPGRFLMPSVSAGQVRLEWTGDGQLESAPAVTGPWTAVSPAPASPHTEAAAAGAKFYRLKQ